MRQKKNGGDSDKGEWKNQISIPLWPQTQIWTWSILTRLGPAQEFKHMCQAEPAPASGGPPCVQCRPICPAKLAPDLSDRLPGPAVLGSGSEPTVPRHRTA